MDSGQLSAMTFGHPPGSLYVRISATTLDDCDRAKQLLGPIAQLPDFAWQCGWELRGASGKIESFELQIFPAVSR